MYGTPRPPADGIRRDRAPDSDARTCTGQRRGRRDYRCGAASADRVPEQPPTPRRTRRRRAGGPPPARPPDPLELGFTPRKPVPWLAPVLLLSTGVRTLLAMLFGAYLDKRELQNALPGDGLPTSPAPTASCGWTTSPTSATASTPPTRWRTCWRSRSSRSTAHRLPRGAGAGDGRRPGLPDRERQAYEDRCKGPYQAALPCPPPDAAAADAVRGARQPRLVRRPDRVPAAVRPRAGRQHRRLADRAVPLVLRGRAAARTGGCSRSTSSPARTSTTRSCATSRGRPSSSARRPGDPGGAGADLGQGRGPPARRTTRSTTSSVR